VKVCTKKVHVVCQRSSGFKSKKSQENERWVSGGNEKILKEQRAETLRNLRNFKLGGGIAQVCARPMQGLQKEKTV
jgi:hypothetical protein